MGLFLDMSMYIVKSVVYRGHLVERVSGLEESYVGLTGDKFKTRYGGHKNSFKYRSKRGKTTLSEHYWKLTDRGVEFDITWSYLKQVDSYSPGTGKCNLCLTEKHFIMYQKNLASLNTRSELSTSCRHRAKFLLSNC